MPISASEHRQIVKAIASGDPEAAGRALFDHVMESKERTIKNNLKQQAHAASASAEVRPLVKRKDAA
jgi:DNA-binding FadR family transcriptional regulator